MVEKVEPVYCTPEDVAETLDLQDPDDPYGTMHFSDLSHPSYSRVCKMIKSNEDIIDRTLRKSWRENRVVNQVFSIDSYWHDINAFRSKYYVEGGNYVQLRKDVLPWDPTKGDKMEVKTRSNLWIDVSGITETTFMEAQPGLRTLDGAVAGSMRSFWFDYHLGKLYLRTGFFQNLPNSLRITYRYGTEVPLVRDMVLDEDGDPIIGEDGEPKTDVVRNEFGWAMVDRDSLDVPEPISRMCSLMTAIQILNMQMFNVKVGVSGDLGPVRDTVIRSWQDEINMIKTSYQRSGSVRSLYG